MVKERSKMKYRVYLISPFGKIVKTMGLVERIVTEQQARNIASVLKQDFPGATVKIESLTLAGKMPLEVAVW